MKAHSSTAGVMIAMEPVEAEALLQNLEKIDNEALLGATARTLYQTLRQAVEAIPAPVPETPAPEAKGRPTSRGKVVWTKPPIVESPVSSAPGTPAPAGQRRPALITGPVTQPALTDRAASPDFKFPAGLDPKNAEFTVRVTKGVISEIRSGVVKLSLARTFRDLEGEGGARDFYTRTIAVHNSKVREHEAAAYTVELGVQDRRQHRVDRHYTPIERTVCKGK